MYDISLKAIFHYCGLPLSLPHSPGGTRMQEDKDWGGWVEAVEGAGQGQGAGSMEGNSEAAVSVSLVSLSLSCLLFAFIYNVVVFGSPSNISIFPCSSVISPCSLPPCLTYVPNAPFSLCLSLPLCLLSLSCPLSHVDNPGDGFWDGTGRLPVI